MYTKTTSKKGSIMFFKDGKRVSAKDIPEVERYIIEGLTREQAEQIVNAEHGGSEETLASSSEPSLELDEGNLCIFCKVSASTSKFVNGITADLCQEDYYSKTTGEIAEQLRKTHAISHVQD